MNNIPGINFYLGENIDSLRDAVSAYAQAEISPLAAHIDRLDQFPMDQWKKWVIWGCWGLPYLKNMVGPIWGTSRI